MAARGASGIDIQHRLRLVGVLFVLANLVLVGRLVKVQLLDHEELSDRARSLQSRRTLLAAERGRILDRSGRILAFTCENASIYAHREEIEDLEGACQVLESLGVDRRTARDRLAGDSGFTWILRDLLSEARTQATLDGVPGLYVQREPKRVRPFGTLARGVIGTWSEDDDLLSGVEHRFDDLLRGESGWATIVVDAMGTVYTTRRRQAPRPGCDVVLSLDARVQEIAELALRRCLTERKAGGGSLVVIDPRTGDVVALASLDRDGANHRNRAVLDMVEVGSCAKVVVATAALEDGLCDTTTTFFCGALPDEERPPVVRDDHGDAEWLSFQMVIAESRNVGTARIARLVGTERMHAWLARFGFGSPSGIELPCESAGLLRPEDEWSGRSLETVAIGYEFATTPLQITLAYAAVANGGRLMRPRLVRELRDGTTGRSLVFKPEPVRRVMSEETARTLRAVLRRAAQPGGTGARADVSWTDIAGKTGTARKFDHELGRYNGNRHVSSFVGFAPWDDPRYVIGVVIDEPQGGYYGADVAAPVFREVLEKVAALDPGALRDDQREIVGDPPAPNVGPHDVLAAPSRGLSRRVPDLRGFATLAARRQAARLGYETEVLGTGGRVVHQSPPPFARGGHSMVLYTEDETPSTVTVPDLAGLTLRDALAELARQGLSGERRGVGSVIDQSPPAGTVVPRGEAVRVILRDVPRRWSSGGS